MGRKTESLQHALIRQVEEKKNNQTSKSYRKNVKKFVALGTVPNVNNPSRRRFGENFFELYHFYPKFV